MEHRAVGHRARQIGAEAAIGGHRQTQALQATGIIKTDLVAVEKRVAFARDQKILIAVVTHLDRTFEFVSRHRRPHRRMTGLGLFAPKATAHALAGDAHRVEIHPQGMRHPMLHLGRVLAADIDLPLTLLQGLGIGHLAFQIKVLLAPHFQFTLKLVRGLLQSGLGVTALHEHGRQHMVFLGQGLLHGQHRRQRFVIDSDLARRLPCLNQVVGHHQAHHLPQVLHQGVGKNRLVVHHAAHPRRARHIAGQDHALDPWPGQSGRNIDRQNLGVGLAGQDGGGVERAFEFRQVIHIERATVHMGLGAFMPGVLALGHAWFERG